LVIYNWKWRAIVKCPYYGFWKDPWPLTAEQLKTKLGHANGQSLLMHTMLETSRLLDIFRNFTIFEEEENKIIKKVCRYQQFRAVNKTLDKLKRREGRIIWHTQGSGKSLTTLYMDLKLKRESKPMVLKLSSRRLDGEVVTKKAT
jgi:type I restriction enzyme R subunit